MQICMYYKNKNLNLKGVLISGTKIKQPRSSILVNYGQKLLTFVQF